MAKVELNGIVGDAGSANVGALVNDGEVSTEYASKVWEESRTCMIIDELLSKRKIVQRKIDAARKKLKRVTNRLNFIEKSWNPA